MESAADPASCIVELAVWANVLKLLQFSTATDPGWLLQIIPNGRMTSLSVMRSSLPLVRSQPVVCQAVRLTHTSNVDQGQKSSVPGGQNWPDHRQILTINMFQLGPSPMATLPSKWTSSRTRWSGPWLGWMILLTGVERWLFSIFITWL